MLIKFSIIFSFLKLKRWFSFREVQTLSKCCSHIQYVLSSSPSRVLQVIQQGIVSFGWCSPNSSRLNIGTCSICSLLLCSSQYALQELKSLSRIDSHKAFALPLPVLKECPR